MPTPLTANNMPLGYICMVSLIGYNVNRQGSRKNGFIHEVAYR